MPIGIYKRTKKMKTGKNSNSGFQKGYNSRLGIKHTKATKEKMRKAHLGKIVSKITRKKLRKANLGKKLTEVTKQKMKGGNSTSFKKGHTNGMLGKKHSKKTRIKMSGKNNNFWKGGITPLTKQIRHCFEYRQWRSDVFTRDDYTCQKCGIRGGHIEADHYPKKFSDIFHENNIKSLEQALICEEFWNINNGRTLCKKCHRLI